MKNHELISINIHRIIRCLSSILPQSEIKKIEDVENKNVKQLISLAQAHLRFARLAEGPSSWRQRVSRGYYSVYNISRAIRLAVNGDYYEDTKDHKRIGDLPDDFPSVNQWKELLTKFRGDRNLADYDHSVSEKSLELRSIDYLNHARVFLNDAKIYLKLRGTI